MKNRRLCLLLGLILTWGIEKATSFGVIPERITTASKSDRLARSGDTKLNNVASSSSSSSPSLSSSTLSLGHPICQYHQVNIPTSQSGPPRQEISVEDLTPTVVRLLQDCEMKHGTVTIISRHTTTSITINERESRLAQDLAEFLFTLAPPDERSESSRRQSDRRYFHNDINQRPDGEEEAQRCRDNGWDIDNPSELENWRKQEPFNAHSHLLSMILGSSECIPIVDGKMMIGQWQSILLVDLDGPRDRTVGIQFMGYS